MFKCLEKKILCVFKESDLLLTTLEKDDLHEKIYYNNGLVAYLILSKESLETNVLNK